MLLSITKTSGHTSFSVAIYAGDANLPLQQQNRFHESLLNYLNLPFIKLYRAIKPTIITPVIAPPIKASVSDLAGRARATGQYAIVIETMYITLKSIDILPFLHILIIANGMRHK